jgi:hypothetical protein
LVVPNSFPLTHKARTVIRLAETSQGINLIAEERENGCKQKGILYKLVVRVEKEEEKEKEVVCSRLNFF